MLIRADHEQAAALARLRAERADAEVAYRRARLAEAQYQEDQRLARADRVTRRLLGGLRHLGQPRTQPHYEALLSRDSEPVRLAPHSNDRRDAA
ncbi:MAG: hypothetical protein ACTHNK_12225 [Thermomicrobiales bacterium]